MKTKIILSSIVYFAICVLVFNACCKSKPCQDPYNPQCINYDPCHKAKPNANFVARVSCWNSMDEIWNDEAVKQMLFTDTFMRGDALAFLPTYEGKTKCRYKWKFDGMSKIYNDSLIKDVSFDSYTDNINNMADSIYTKPLGVNFTVTCRPSNCVGADTSFTFKRYITFAVKEMVFGEFRGTFSNKPNDSITISVMRFEKQTDPTSYGRYALINFPFYKKDTVFLKNNQWGAPPNYSSSDMYSYQTYNQRRIYDLDPNKSTTDFVNSGGIIDLVFKGRMGASGRNEVQFICKQKLNINAPITEIIFKGYQTKFYLNKLILP